ncbi:duf221 domain-containing protein [Phlyctema vagabunda]|uniref:Duf221 domain-containing protein n=1 Tax=Phlyctema vagabunda TaxID=108571 RepID=A0ABR4P7W2_9HELO
MASRDLVDVVYTWAAKRQLDQCDDPRVGSARNNSSSSKVFTSASPTNSNSFKSMISTLVPVIVYAAVCILIFWGLRARCPRVYAPRTFLSSLYPHEQSKPLPKGWFSWVVPWLNVPDTDVLNQSSLDGYLFLRFLRVLCVICLVGCCITWPVLLPLHAQGGVGNKQMDKLTFGNVTNPQWYYVHALLAWIFFGFVMYMISRECVYYINLRQAYLVSPYYAKRLSSRTVLFTSVPRQLLDGAKLRKIFGDTVRNVWIPGITEELEDLVKERDQTALRLEKAEIELIKMANLERAKAERFGHPDIEADIGTKARDTDEEARQSADTEKSDKSGTEDSGFAMTAKNVDSIEFRPSNEIQESTEVPDLNLNPEATAPESRSDRPLELKWGVQGYGNYGPPPDVNGSVAAQWIPHEQRPHHRPIANYGRRVDTIKWTRNRLKELIPRIDKLKRQHKSGKSKLLSAAFVEFDSQVDAQGAYQSLAHHRAFQMTPHINGIRPSEIVWTSLRIPWWERIVRKFLISGFVAVMVVFWSIPAALIGTISNISYLTKKLFFLRWIDDLPAPILGVLTGLVPAVALAFLMGLVPGIMRMCARQSGISTLSMVELFVQQTYFIFQVVQVFLITTITSAASAAITDIISDPLSVKELLSANLPKASNFYVSYFILQGLAMSATRIVHLSSIFRFHVLKTSANPRFISTKWHRLRVVRWGSIYPVFTNMAVIAMSYSCIAPLVLGFASIAFYLIYRVYHYNLVYVYGSEIDTRGLLYPHALKQVFTGVYFAEICLLGLFGLRSAFGPLVLMIMLIVITALINMSLNDALGPLLYNLPKTLAAQGLYEEIEEANPPLPPVPDLEDPENFQPMNEADLPEYLREERTGSRAVEGADAAGKMTMNFLSQSFKQRAKSSGLDIPRYISYVDFWTAWISPDPKKKPNFVLMWLHPGIFADFAVLSKMIPDDLPDPDYPGDTARDAFWPPAVIKECPVLWIPRDKGGISKQEVAHTRKAGIGITDKGVSLDDKNTLVFDLGAKSPVIMERIRY